MDAPYVTAFLAVTSGEGLDGDAACRSSQDAWEAAERRWAWEAEFEEQEGVEEDETDEEDEGPSRTEGTVTGGYLYDVVDDVRDQASKDVDYAGIYAAMNVEDRG